MYSQKCETTAVDVSFPSSRLSNIAFFVVFLGLRPHSRDSSVAYQILKEFKISGVITIALVANASPVALQTCFDLYTSESDDDLGQNVKTLAQKLNAPPYSGVVPSTNDGLLALGVEAPVASSLLVDTFGSTSPAIYLETKKLVCALDLFDWEEPQYWEAGAVVAKSVLKMDKIKDTHVRRSLETWVPAGDLTAFITTANALGSILPSSKGAWGTLMNALATGFSTKEREQAKDIMVAANRFFVATSRSKRRMDLSIKQLQEEEDGSFSDSDGAVNLQNVDSDILLVPAEAGEGGD